MERGVISAVFFLSVLPCRVEKTGYQPVMPLCEQEKNMSDIF